MHLQKKFAILLKICIYCIAAGYFLFLFRFLQYIHTFCCFKPLDTSMLTPRLTIDDLKQSKVGYRIKCLIFICEMCCIHVCVSPELLKISQETAEGGKRFEEEADEGDPGSLLCLTLLN